MGSLGSLLGGVGGSFLGGPVGGSIGSQVGGFIGGGSDSSGGTRPFSNEPNYWNYDGYLPPGSRPKGYSGPSRRNWLSGVWQSPDGTSPPASGVIAGETGSYSGSPGTAPRAAGPSKGGLRFFDDNGITSMGLVAIA